VKEYGLPASWEEWQGAYTIGWLGSGIASVLRDADAAAW
jgi:hypothetical protein